MTGFTFSVNLITTYLLVRSARVGIEQAKLKLGGYIDRVWYKPFINFE